MDIIAIGTFLLGAALGLKFRVFVLLPVMLAGMVVICLSASHIASTENALDLLTFVLAIQFGYMFGVIARFTTAAARRPAPGMEMTSATKETSKLSS